MKLQQKQLQEVQVTIKSEISTWSDVEKKTVNGNPDAPLLKQVEKAVESVASKSSRNCNKEDTSLTNYVL